MLQYRTELVHMHNSRWGIRKGRDESNSEKVIH